jgi:enoyl-CoA hydratase/carnithine racemase
MSANITLTINSGVALITFNRSESFNTFTQSMMTELGDAYQQCDSSDEVRVVVTTGAGKAYCAGADLNQGAATFDTQDNMTFSSCPLSFQAWQIRKPVIAACNGHAIGVGLGIAMQSDIRFFAEQGKYGFLQARRGVVADFGVHHILPRLVGAEVAFEMILSARRYSGLEAVALGLARQALPADQVLAAAMALATEIAEQCSPLVTGMAKKLIWDGFSQSLAQAINAETKALHYSMGRVDAIEGVSAYIEKRSPQWQGNVGKDWPEWL